ncbi:MAG TPA: hypothetical protein VL201_01355, partial [Patescibacteria group bacterium]|nr:hypothetical protein [Patescibacteria group bacterium]
KLNRSSTILELSTLKEFFKKVWYIIPLLGLDGIADNFQGALLGNNAFNLFTGLAEGLKNNLYNLKNQYNFTDVNHKGLQKYYEGIDNGWKDEKTKQIYPINKRMGAFLLGSHFLFSGSFSAGDRTDICQNIFRKNNITIPYPIAASLTLGRSLLSNYLVYVLLQDQMQGVANTYTTLQKLHTRTVAVSKYLKTIEKIEKLLQSHPDNNVQLFYRDCLATKKTASKKMRTVLKLLQTDTFSKDRCTLYLRGKVLLAHKLLQEAHKELIDRIRNVALIDAHVAVATFIKESEQKQMPTCFVEFVDSAKPIELTITNGWSPLIVCQKQVCNSLSLGNEGARTIILTGPNGCGKSTILRVLGIVAWLSQTFGIAPAESARVSLFHSIRTSLRINDNAATGLSTYMAADAAAERIQTHIDLSNEQHHSLILYGEPYRGTPDQETTRKIMEFCHHIVPNKHFLMALETHVYEPTLLKTEMPLIFTNGHMEIKEDVDGNFIRTFVLKDGPANWWFLDHAKRRRFVDWITVIRKQEEIAQKAYEAALIQAYEAAVAQAKKEQEERVKKENANNYLQKTVNGIKSLLRLH